MGRGILGLYVGQNKTRSRIRGSGPPQYGSLFNPTVRWYGQQVSALESRHIHRSETFLLPPVTRNARGEARRTGFELEFGNAGVAETAEKLQQTLGGRVREKNPFVFYVDGSDLGELRIERDAELLTGTRDREALAKLAVSFDEGTLAREMEQGVDRLARNLIPCEVVTVPLEYGDFDKLNLVVSALNGIDAEGTQYSLKNAFGTHFNPEIPALDAETSRNYLQAFLLLADWIIADSGTDFSRRFFTRFIDPFPEPYCRKVLAADYAPAMAELIDHYLEFNPTRNRGLDMLPLFAEVDRPRVMSGVRSSERDLVKSRPALHYRLPDCRLGERHWSLVQEWNRWWLIEVVAADDSLRKILTGMWRRIRNGNVLGATSRWVDAVDEVIATEISPPESP